ncbi:hypothetical protein ACQ9Y2_19750 [Pseudomonas palleroniana]
MGDTDSPDFNKARGFLIGYSVAVTLLWFFGANLNQFKLMGNEISLRQNIQHVWIVIAIINVYLWFRFFQRLPKRALRFDDKMHEILDETLISMCHAFHKRRAFKCADDNDNEAKLISLKMWGSLPYRDDLEQEQGREFGPTGPWDYSYPYRAKVWFRLTKTYDGSNQPMIAEGGNGYEATPSKTLYRAAVTYAFVKGAVRLSWFTDNIWPLLLGCFSISMALYKWWQINQAANIGFINAFNQLLIPI